MATSILAASWIPRKLHQDFDHSDCCNASINASLRRGLEAATLWEVMSNSLPDLNKSNTSFLQGKQKRNNLENNWKLAETDNVTNRQDN